MAAPSYGNVKGALALAIFLSAAALYIDDANLALDFFRYSPAMKALMRECLRFKAEHNLERMGLMPSLGVR